MLNVIAKEQEGIFTLAILILLLLLLLQPQSLPPLLLPPLLPPVLLLPLLLLLLLIKWRPAVIRSEGCAYYHCLDIRFPLRRPVLLADGSSLAGDDSWIEKRVYQFVIHGSDHAVQKGRWHTVPLPWSAPARHSLSVLLRSLGRPCLPSDDLIGRLRREDETVRNMYIVSPTYDTVHDMR